MNQIWKLEPGWLAVYCEDRDVIRRIKRSKKDWAIMCDYFKNDRLIAVQFKVPVVQRRVAERMLGIAENRDNEAV
ncbi:hypothetical protein COJ96_06840 [Bacillus sp. AFS073361]|uniref:hypothetical protein n=1 Tax=Bacillus sp. AFS073361 TaxID=2033511 RepID=UPI000BF35F76|nr:hypothetical protein [Bacillus sp. AFS073361]PFP30129.1 hypothetical protein COJ96_06840 [Bacillus sp. AFS073361]